MSRIFIPQSFRGYFCENLFAVIMITTADLSFLSLHSFTFEASSPGSFFSRNPGTFLISGSSKLQMYCNTSSRFAYTTMKGELIMAYFLLLRIIQRVHDQINSTNVSQLWQVMLQACRAMGTKGSCQHTTNSGEFKVLYTEKGEAFR